MRITWQTAKEECAKLGFTLRASGPREYVLYLRGTGQNFPGSYYTDSADDALATCKAMRAELLAE